MHAYSKTYCTPECAAAHDLYCNDGKCIAQITKRCLDLGMRIAEIQPPAPLRQQLAVFGGDQEIIDSNWPRMHKQLEVRPMRVRFE